MASNITVKNGANQDKVFTLISQAAGDGGTALWALKEGTISTVFPRFTAMARPVAHPRGPARQLKLKLNLPSSYTDVVTGITTVKSAGELNVTATMPDDFPEDRKDDWVAFATNLINSAPVRVLIRDALSAT